MEKRSSLRLSGLNERLTFPSTKRTEDSGYENTDYFSKKMEPVTHVSQETRCVSSLGRIKTSPSTSVLSPEKFTDSVTEGTPSDLRFCQSGFVHLGPSFKRPERKEMVTDR